MTFEVRHKTFTVVVLASFVSACTGERGETGWTVSTDTVDGVVRTINTPPAAPVAAQLVAEEEFRVGTMEGGGPTSFGLIRSVAVLPDDRFAVADAQASEVRVFDRDGQHLRTFGGDGAGPGELRGMQGVHVDHEGLLRVAEQGNVRLSVFHPDSGFVRSFPLRMYSYGFRGPWNAAVDSAGRTFVASSGQYGVGRYWNMLRIYDPSMNQLDSIPYNEYTNDNQEEEPPGAWRVALANGFTYAQVPFYPRIYGILTPTGEFWSSADGKPQVEIARWRPGGDTSFVFVSRRQPEPVTPAERDSAMAEVRESLSQRAPNPPNLDASRVPATKPPLYDVSLDDLGRLWVRITSPVVDTTVYDIFDRDGRYAETVALPFRIDQYVPPVVRGATMWTVVTDDLDVQYVVRARLGPPPRR